MVFHYNRLEFLSIFYSFSFFLIPFLFASSLPYIGTFFALILPVVLSLTEFSGIFFIFFIGSPPSLSWNMTFGGVSIVQVVSYVFNAVEVR